MSESHNIRVHVLNFDPVVPAPADDGRFVPLHKACGWNSPRDLATQYRADIREATEARVQFEISGWADVDEFPHKVDDFRYSSEEYQECHRTGDGWHAPDGVDYERLIAEHHLGQIVDSGQADEVWLFGGPYFGYWESVMAGPRAFFINGGPLTQIACNRPFVIMGFNFERTAAEMLHNLAHRIEFTMSHFASQEGPAGQGSEWEAFSAYELESGEPTGCGRCHFPPNAERDYDYANPRRVKSNADNWLSYPELAGQPAVISCQAWGGPDYHRNYLKWWFSRIPRAAGENAQTCRQNDWWKYIVEFDNFGPGGWARG